MNQELQSKVSELENELIALMRLNVNGELDFKVEELRRTIEILSETEETETDEVLSIKKGNLEIHLPSEPIRFPLSTSTTNLSNRGVNYKTVAMMTLESNFDTKESREEILDMGREWTAQNYLYHNKIIDDLEFLESLTDWKAKTIKTNVAKLCKLDNNMIVKVDTEEGKIIYLINYANVSGEHFITVEEPILKVLTKVTNSNVIKVYLLIRALCEHQERKTGFKEKLITREYISEFTGIKDLDTISTITESLADMDLISKRTVVSRDDYGKIKQKVFYTSIDYDNYVTIKKAKKEARTIYVTKGRK